MGVGVSYLSGIAPAKGLTPGKTFLSNKGCGFICIPIFDLSLKTSVTVVHVVIVPP